MPEGNVFFSSFLLPFTNKSIPEAQISTSTRKKKKKFSYNKQFLIQCGSINFSLSSVPKPVYKAADWDNHEMDKKEWTGCGIFTDANLSTTIG